VDVTYINGTTWAEETVQCRQPGNPTPVKVESYTLDGVLDENRAYRIGMRRLLGYQLQRLQHTTSTEMDALCYEFMDRIVLADDIPGGQTLSCLITDMTYDSSKITMTLSEAPDWSFQSPRVIIRHQDGRASAMVVPTRIDDFTISVPYSAALEPELWAMNDAYIEPPRLLFCSSVRVPYDALVGNISGQRRISQVTAIQYHPGNMPMTTPRTPATPLNSRSKLSDPLRRVFMPGASMTTYATNNPLGQWIRRTCSITPRTLTLR
jgi:hypothetical protein